MRRIVDASFIASYSKRTGDRPEEVIKRLDSPDTLFVLVKPSEVKEGKVIYASSLEEASAIAFEEFARSGGELFTDEVKAVEGVLILGLKAPLVYPPTRSGITAKAVLRKSASVIPPVFYEKERRLPVNIKGARAVRKFIENNPECRIVEEEEGWREGDVVLSKEKNGYSDGAFFYRIIPIRGIKRENYPKLLIKRALELLKEKVTELRSVA